jgi:hypothetical protein
VNLGSNAEVGMKLATVALLVGIAAPAAAHEVIVGDHTVDYGGLRSPAGKDCCGGQHCRPVPWHELPGGRIEVEVNGRWWPAEPDNSLPPIDANAHACQMPADAKPRCIILPNLSV